HVSASAGVAKTLVFCWTNGPACVALKAGDDAAPVSTIPFALGSCPVQVSATLCWLGAAAAVQPLPRSAGFNSDARAALVAALVWWTAGVPAASTIASRTRTTR